MPIAQSIQAIDMLHMIDGLSGTGGKVEIDRMAGLLNMSTNQFMRQMFNQLHNGDPTVMGDMVFNFASLIDQMPDHLFQDMQTEKALGYMASQVREIILKDIRLPLESERMIIVVDTLARELGERVVLDRKAFSEVLDDPEPNGHLPYGNGH